MRQQEPINTPLLAGWTIAIGAGAVAFGVSLVVVNLDGNGAVFVGAVVALVVGLIMGFPLRPLPGPNETSVPRASGAPGASSGVPSPAAPPAPAAAPEPVASTAVAPEPAPEPAPAAAPPQDSGTRPMALAAARGGAPDDLQKIKGVGPKLETLLHSLGIYHFDQIAAWNEAELAWVDSHLEGFYGRASRDEWVPQARILAAGGETGLSGGQG
ncbi:MAG: NADH:ubiquinone oxidoreductase [Pararhodobacter sp.]